MTDAVKIEAKILADRLCLKPAIVESWMRIHRLNTIIDLKTRYPGKSHAECMDLANNEIWEFM
jgi:hypothetical protein